MVMANDFAMIWLFLLFILFLYGRIRSVTAEVDSNVITAADYAVFVQGLPIDANEEEVKDHFDRLYDLRKPDWTFPSSCKRCCFLGRKMQQRRQFYRKGAEPPEILKRKLELWRELRDDEVYPVLGECFRFISRSVLLSNIFSVTDMILILLCCGRCSKYRE